MIASKMPNDYKIKIENKNRELNQLINSNIHFHKYVSIDLIEMVRVALQHGRVQSLCVRFLILSLTSQLAEFINDEIPIAVRAKDCTLDRQHRNMRTKLYACLSLEKASLNSAYL